MRTSLPLKINKNNRNLLALKSIMSFQDDAEARLPRIVASLFMSPGGDKFYRLLFDFSSYVVTKVMQNEHGE